MIKCQYYNVVRSILLLIFTFFCRSKLEGLRDPVRLCKKPIKTIFLFQHVYKD